MSHETKMAGALLAVVLLGASACADPQEVSDLKGKVDEVQAQQKEILAKLDKLAAGQKNILARPAAAAAKPSRPQEDPNKVYKLSVGNSFTKGPEDAAVTIVEFSDFQCPFCSQAAGLISKITEEYPDDVRFVYKNYPLPFHKEAMPAAKAAIAAGKQGKFFEMHDYIFANYRQLKTKFAEDKYYTEAAEKVGLDVNKYKKDFDNPSTAKLIQDEMAEARTAGVRGTPTIFINGKKPQGRSFELYKGIIDGILKEKS